MDQIKICNKILNNINNIIKDGGENIDKDGKPSAITKGFFVSFEDFEKTFDLNNINMEEIKADILKKLDFINKYKNTFLRILDRKQQIVY